MYIDESGDTIALEQGGKKFLVLTGLIIDEDKVNDIDKALRDIKNKYYGNYEIEFKSNFLRYANPKLSEKSPMKLNSFEKYQQLEAELADFMKQLEVIAISVVSDKEAYWNGYPSQNPYEIAYVYLLERFQKHLSRIDNRGLCIIDPRQGQVEKHYFDDDIGRIHDGMRHNDSVVWQQCPNIVEKLLYAQSEKTVGIQIADLFCYPVFHIFEYDQLGSEYWRFEDITKPKLEVVNGRLLNYGLKFFPDTNKNSLRLFSEGYF